MITGVSKYVKGCDALSAIPAAKQFVTEAEALIGKGEKLMVYLESEDKLISVAVSTATDKVIAPLFAVVKAEELYFTKQNNLPLVAGLAPYNVTEELLTTVEANMQVLTAANAKQEAYNADKKVKRTELEQLVNEGRGMLDEMDMVADIISLTHPEAFKGYTEVRSKKEYAERLTTITVLNSETGKPEENVRVRVLSTTRTVDGKPFVLLDRKTGKTGEVRNSKREFDIYNITAEKIACDIESQQLVLADSTPQRIELRLKKRKM